MTRTSPRYQVSRAGIEGEYQNDVHDVLYAYDMAMLVGMCTIRCI